MVETSRSLFPRRIARYKEMVRLRDTQLKLYTVLPEGMADYSQLQCTEIVDLLRGKTEQQMRLGSSGLGFLMISEEVANVCTWDGVMLLQSLYEFNPEKFGKNAKLKKNFVDREGSFCCWELEVAAHEGTAWRRFLSSSRTLVDRCSYELDRFEGIVG